MSWSLRPTIYLGLGCQMLASKLQDLCYCFPCWQVRFLASDLCLRVFLVLRKLDLDWIVLYTSQYIQPTDGNLLWNSQLLLRHEPATRINLALCEHAYPHTHLFCIFGELYLKSMLWNNSMQHLKKMNFQNWRKILTNLEQRDWIRTQKPQIEWIYWWILPHI